MEWHRAWWASVSLAWLLAGCETGGQFLPDDHRFVSLSPTATVLIYSPEGRGELSPDICAGAPGLLPLEYIPGEVGLPAVIHELAAGSDDLIIYADCSYARGQTGAAELETSRPEPCFARGAEPAPGYLELKTCRRLADLERLVQEVHRNLPADRIFVAGSGVGGWAALLAARNPFRKFNAAVAIDPAITSDAVGGNETWMKAIDRHLAYLADTHSLPVLLFVPASGPGSRLADLAPSAPDFERVQGAASAATIRAYIACRIAAPQSPCAPGAGGSS